MSIDICEEGIPELLREQRLSAVLLKIGTIITTIADFDECMRMALQESARATCSDGAGLIVGDGSTFVVRAIHNLDPDLVGKSVPGDYLTAGGSSPDLAMMIGAGAVTTIQVGLKGKTTGYLFFTSHPARPVQDRDIRFVEKTAPLISLALENQRIEAERDQLQKEIEEERRLFDALLEEMPIGVIIAEAPTGRLIRANEQVERIWRYPLLKPVDAPYKVYTGYHPDGRPYNSEEWPLARSLAAGELVNGEEVGVMRGDGTDGVVSVSSSPIRDVRGRIIAAVATYTDVTERRQVEQAVRESESKFRKIAYAAQDAVILISNEGRVEFWNDAATKMFQFTGEEVMGKHLHSYIMPERYAADFNRGFNLFRTSGEGRFVGKTYEIMAMKKDGTEFPVELSLAALKLRGNWNAIGIVRDITERKKAEQAIKESVGDLQRSNEELARFAYVASHDLQEPLRTVSSFVELLRRKYEGKLDEKADTYITFAVEGARRMSTLITDLLAYSRVGTQGAEFKPVEMDAVFRQAVSNLKAAIRENDAGITAGPLPTVSGDQTQLTQLFQNLIANAIKFRRKDGRPLIHVSAEHAEHEWVFGVRDNGIGIDPAYFDRIFVIFERLHTREEYPGTGVGLAICKRIVERHGGRMWVESKPEAGSEFYFTLPLRREDGNDTNQRNGKSN